MLSYVRLWGPSWSKGRTAGNIFGREPSNDYFIKIFFLLSKWFQTRRFLWEFPIGSYVKLSSAVVAMLNGGLKCQTYVGRGPLKDHFSKVWLRLAQDIQFQRRRFFSNFIPPFSIFSLAAILVGSRDHRTKFWKGAIQGPFHQSLVAIGPVVSEKKINM